MICERCHEEPVTVRFTKIINGEKIHFNLCEKCAKETTDMYNNSDLSFQNFFSGILDKKYSANRPQILQCDKCNMTYNQFRKTGKFGCSNCYDAFSSHLNTVFKQIHGNSLHTGKIPGRTGEELIIKKNITELQDKLKMAIEKEEYEEAARLRDQIKELKKEGGN